MIFIQQKKETARFIARKLRRYTGGTSKPTVLLVRFGDSDHPGKLSDASQYTLVELQTELTKILLWTEEIPCWLWVAQNGFHPLVPKAIHFLHRLDCFTGVYTDGTSIDMDIAHSWIDAGLRKVCVGLGGLSNAVHHFSINGDVAEATNAVRILLAAKREKAASLEIDICVPWTEKVPAEIDSILSWAKELGVDGVQIVKPFSNTPLGSLRALEKYTQYRHPRLSAETLLGRAKRQLPHNKLQRLLQGKNAFVVSTDPQRVELSIDKNIVLGSSVQPTAQF